MLRARSKSSMFWVTIWTAFAILALAPMSLLASPGSNPDSTLRLPIDLYFLADRSNSIAANQWTNIVNFANDLRKAMANLAGGYYVNSTAEGEGLRVSITAFGCNLNNNQPRQQNVLTGPTGDETLINQAITKLRNTNSLGGTCPSGGLNKFKSEIEANRLNENPRPTAIIVLTDGAITSADFSKVRTTAQALREIDEVQMFGINYGGGDAVQKQWNQLVGDPSRVFRSKDLDQVSKLISVFMLGKLEVDVVPTADQIRHVSNFTTSKNTTICLGDSSVPVHLKGRSVDLFGASGLSCEIKRLENNQTVTVAPVERNGNTFCDVPASFLRTVVAPNKFMQSLSLNLVAVKGAQRTQIFDIPYISFDVVVCVNVKFVGLRPGDNENCFPPADPRNSSVGYLAFQGPTVEAGSFFCRFDQQARVQATRVGNELQCIAPGVDVATALAQGTDPTPFHEFVIEPSTGAPLLDSNLDNNDFTPVSCINTAQATRDALFCYNSGTGAQSTATFEGKSLDNLVLNHQNLEFSCVYSFAGIKAETIGTLNAGTRKVTCGAPPLKQLLASGYAPVPTSRNLSVEIRVRSSNGAPTRGWWTMKTDTAYPVKVSPCVDAGFPTDTVCIGETYTVGYSNEGIANFLQAKNPTCVFTTNSSQVLASRPMTFAQGRGSCSLPEASGLVQRVQVREGSSVLLDSAVSAANRVSPCFELERSFVESNATFCWGKALSQEQIVITGDSLPYYAAPRSLPMCRFTLNGQNVVRTPAVRDGANSLVCSYPRDWGFRPAPFNANIAFALEDTNEGYSLADPRGVARLRVQSCVKRAKASLDPVDVGKALPSCAPDCCLQDTLQVRFTGAAADNITLCDWIAENGTTLTTTAAIQTNASESMICALSDWRPLNTNSVLPVVDVKAYADNERSFVLGETSMDTRKICAYSQFDSGTQITLGSSLRISFNGPTMRSLVDEVKLKCALMMPKSGNSRNLYVARLVTATVESGSFVCEFDQMYDSLKDASLSVYLFDLNSSEEDAADASPSRLLLRRRQRRLRVLQEQDEEEDSLANGIPLFTESLQNVQVSSRVESIVSPEPCVLISEPTMKLRFSGPGAPGLVDSLLCSFQYKSEKVETFAPDFDTNRSELTCTWRRNGTLVDQAVIHYNASVIRKDNNQTLSVFQGETVACLAFPTSTPAPTQEAAAGLGGGAIAGIVIALIALVLLVVGAVLYDRHRKEQKKRKAREAALAAKRRNEDEEEARRKAAEAAGRDNVDKIPLDVIDPAAASKSDTSSSPPRSPLENDNGGDLLDDVTVVAVDGPGAPPRKFQVGDCVQYQDTVDDTWRFTFVRNFAPKPLEYFLEDERQTVPESQMRWPNYAAGEAVEVRKRREGGGEDWVPAVVGFADPEAGIVGLMGSNAEEVPFGDVRPAPFRVGENVEERGPDGEWRPAVVVRCEPDGSFVVDGAGGLGLQRTRRRLRWPQYHGGDIVEVRNSEIQGGDGAWKRATVVTMEGGVVVALQDGTVDPKRFQNWDVRRPLTVKTTPVTLDESSMMGGEEQSSPRRKFKHREPLDFVELPDFCFEITVDKKHGLGVRFGWTRDQLIVVQKFLGLAGMDAGPLEASERVSMGDQLLAINGTSVGGRSFAEVTEMIRTAPDVITLKFGRWKETVKMKGTMMPRKSEGPASASKRTSENAAEVSLV